jgi:hypothetical protein
MGLFDDVVFVGDIANEFLDEVLHSDNASGAAVFIDHDRHVVGAAAHLVQRP